MTSPRPIVVTGMHRSGTSFIASLISAAGVHLGDRLLDADAANPRGYFEDVTFLDLNRTMLARATPEAAGHRDWGWTLGEQLDRSCFEETKEAARALVAQRNSMPGCWGWKDPRTSVTLDFWHELLIEAGCDPLYVMVYRFPWDVADSMQRIGADVFLRNPEYAPPIWSFYNRHLLSFHDRHPERCLLLSSNVIGNEPERLQALLAARLGAEVPGSFQELKDDSLWRARGADDPIVGLFAATSPECVELLSELDRRADLPATELWRVPSALHPRHPIPAADSEVDLSIILPCYNHGEFLIDAIASVEREAPESTEVIVVNDGSTQPRTIAVLDVLRQAGYRIIDQPNAGLAAARNHGVGLAKGGYILPLDSDNRILPDFAQTAIKVLNDNPETAVVYGDRYDFGMRRGRVQVPVLHLPALLLVNFIDACAVYRRALWTACGGYDPNASPLEDWELWISTSERGWKFHRLDAITFEYRVRPESLLSLTLVPETDAQLYAHIVRKHKEIYRKWMPAIVLEFIHHLVSNPMAARHVEFLASEVRDDWQTLDADRMQWQHRASVAEGGLAGSEARLYELEEQRHDTEVRLRNTEARLRDTEVDRVQWIKRYTHMQAKIEAVQEQLASIQSSASWRWTQNMLNGWPIRQLLGTIIDRVAARAQQGRTGSVGRHAERNS